MKNAWLLLLSFAISPNLSANSNETKQQLQSVKTEIDSLNSDLNKTKQSKAELYKQLKKQTKAVSKLNNELIVLKAKEKQQNKELARLEQQVSKQTKSHRQQLEALNSQIHTSFINGKPSIVKVLLNQQNPATFARSSRYFHYFNQARQEQIEQINRTLASLSDEQKMLFSAQKKQQKIYQQQKTKHKKLQQQSQQRQVTLKQLDNKISVQGSRLTALYEQEKSLQDLLSSLSKPKTKTVSKQTMQGGSFAKRIGSLSWPINGKVVARYGSPRKVGKLTWQGILISSPSGNDVTAAANGQVIFADWLRGFGLLVIIDHGDQYMTLYGNNQTLMKQVGDTVSAGELIAQSGDKGVRQHAGLYFEIRHKGSPTNPLKWLSKQS